MSSAKYVDYDGEVLTFLVQRVIKDLKRVLDLRKYVKNIMTNSEKILIDLEKYQLSMKFSLEYLKKFLEDGKLDKSDLLAFYSGEDVKKEFALFDVEKLIEATE